MSPSQDTSLVQRLIAFLKKPNALTQEGNAHNSYDDFNPREDAHENRESAPRSVLERARLVDASASSPNSASRLDALMMRIAQQFRARGAYVMRYGADDEMVYLTGRDANGGYVGPLQADPDRRALFLALDSGEAQLFVHHDGNDPVAVLCGPLWADSDDEIIGVLYLDNPARSNLHRGEFDIFCEQAARMVAYSLH